MKIIIPILCCAIICTSTFSQTKVSGNSNLLETSVKYFKPFPEFVNRDLPSYTETDKKGFFNFNLVQEKTSVVKFVVGNMPFEIVLEPNDSVYFHFDQNNLLSISGNNSAGHNYYTSIYDKPRMKKFDKIRDIFEKKRNLPLDKFMTLIKQEFSRKTEWLDSLEYKKKVSKKYTEFLKYEIIGTLSWEVGNLIDKYFPNEKQLKIKNQRMKEKLFEIIDPQNEKLYSTIGGEMYVSMVYLPYIYDKTNKIDTSNIIVPDIPYFSVAPEKYRKYLWGSNLIVNLDFAPEMFNYCELYKKYLRLYGENEITKFLETKNLCKSKSFIEINEKIKIINPIETDFFALINNHFHDKSLYIDLWATWCGPCKLEFSITPKNFHNLLNEYKIEYVYLSIDEENKKDIWKKLIYQLQLEGTHILLNKELLKSIRDVVYNSKDLSVPRYIIVNNSGKITSIDAPRPSDPNIHKVFNKLLRK